MLGPGGICRVAEGLPQVMGLSGQEEDGEGSPS